MISTQWSDANNAINPKVHIASKIRVTGATPVANLEGN